MTFTDMKYFLLIALLSLLCNFVVTAQTRIQKIDTLLEDVHREEAFSGNVLIAEKGKIFYHPGGDIGYTNYFLRNVDKDQAIIILSNIVLLRHYTPTAFMKILNGENYKLDFKSLSSVMGRD